MNESIKQELKDRLNSLPQKIFDNEVALIEKQDLLDKVLFNNKVVEKQVFIDVEAEMDEEGKPRYSNEAKRKSESNKRLRLAQAYQENKVQMEELKRELETEKLVISFLKRKFRATKSLIDLELV